MTVPSTFDWWVNATTFVRSLISSSSRQVEPAVVGRPGTSAATAPVRRHSSCHGTRFAWCSISVTTISSPGPSANRAPPGRARADRRVAERVGDQVDRLGGVLGEDHLVRVGARRTRRSARGPPRRRRWPPRRAGARRGARRRCAGEELLLGVDHLPRPLRGGPGVQVDQRLPVADGARQDREVGPDRGDVQRRSAGRRAGRSSDGRGRCGGFRRAGVLHVAVGLQLVGQLGTAGLDDPAAGEHVHHVRVDVRRIRV